MKVVYIAGPYGDEGGYLMIDRNIAAAREAAADLANHGVGYFCPHLNSAHFEAIVPHVKVDFWYALDLEILDRCDAMLILEDWGKSKGTQREMDHAIAKGIPVFYYGNPMEELYSGEWGNLLEWAKGAGNGTD